ncbi:hypothetical protein GCM10020219_037030 [Nonomuraea dietziae]
MPRRTPTSPTAAPGNLAELHAFLSDTVLLTGHGFAAPEPTPTWGLLDEEPRSAADPGDERGPAARLREGGGAERPVVGVLYYRAHHLAGNTAFVRALCEAIEEAGGRALPVFCSSLRTAEPELLSVLGQADALVVTVLAAGGSRPATAGAGGDDAAWDVGALAELDIPILQGLCLTTSRQAWEENDDGLSPLDAASQVAIPEFDGRIITVPFSFKEVDEDGLTVYVADPERAARVAGTAVRHARLRHVPNADKRLVVMLSAYPTKHARIGNAVGLDTPASTVKLLARLAEAGYDLGEGLPGVAGQDGDALIHALIAAGGQDQDWLTEEQLAANPVRIPSATYLEWYGTLPEELREAMERHWGPAARRAVHARGRHRPGRAQGGQRRGDGAAAPGFRREPDRDLPRPRPAAQPPLPGRLPVAVGGVRGARDGARRQARQPGVAAGQVGGAVGGVRS